MGLLTSHKWTGVGGIVAVLGLVATFIGLLISFRVTDKSVNLQLITSGVKEIRLTPEEAALLLNPRFKFRSVFTANYFLLNIGSKALTPSDYLNPITVLSDPKIKIVSISSKISTDSDATEQWTELSPGKWQMPKSYLNPGEIIAIYVVAGLDSQDRHTSKELSDFIEWRGRFKEIRYPELVWSQVNAESNWNIFWQTPFFAGYHAEWRLGTFVLLAGICYFSLSGLSIMWGYASRPGLFLLINFGFVVMSICTADSINFSSFPSVLVSTNWLNFVMPCANVIAVCLLYANRKTTQ